MPEVRPGVFRLGRDASRPAAIIRVMRMIEERGDEVLELLKEVRSPRRSALLPIYFRRQNADFFALIEPGPWEPSAIEGVLDATAVLRGSGYAGAGLEILASYPVPEEVSFFFNDSAAALFQLRLRDRDSENPENLASTFLEAAEQLRAEELGYDLESLDLSENLLINMLDGEESGRISLPVLDDLVKCLGCYLGEAVRRRSGMPGSWATAEGWGEDFILQLGEFSLDPIGKARAFLENGPKDSVEFYARYSLQQLEIA